MWSKPNVVFVISINRFTLTNNECQWKYTGCTNRIQECKQCKHAISVWDSLTDARERHKQNRSNKNILSSIPIHQSLKIFSLIFIEWIFIVDLTCQENIAYLSAMTPAIPEPTTIPAKCIVPINDNIHWFSLHVISHWKIIIKVDKP